MRVACNANCSYRMRIMIMMMIIIIIIIHMIYNAPNPLCRVLKAQIDKEVKVERRNTREIRQSIGSIKQVSF